MPLRFTLRQLEYFIAVGEAGSVAMAAEKVNVSAPSVSSAITQLEAGFGVQLFTRRHGQGLVPTPAGDRFLVQARAVLAEADRLNDLATAFTDSVRGALRLGCLRTFVPTMVPVLRRGFEEKFANVVLTQQELDQAQILDALGAGRIDLALTYDLALPADITFERLHALPPAVLLAPDHPLAGRDRLTPADLLDHPMVLLDLRHSTGYFMTLFAGLGRRPRISERTADVSVQRSLVASGYGYGITNLRTVSTQAMDGRPLKFIPLDSDQPPLHLGLAMPRAPHLSRTLRAFIDHCHEAVDSGVLPGLPPGG